MRRRSNGGGGGEGVWLFGMVGVGIEGVEEKEVVFD